MVWKEARFTNVDGPEEPLYLIGMPSPHYVGMVFVEGRKYGVAKIVIESFASDGSMQQFLLYANLDRVSPNDDVERRRLAREVARWKIYLGVDTAVGPAIREEGIDPMQGLVPTFPTREKIGFYVEASKRFELFEERIERMPAFTDLSTRQPELAAATYTQALQFVPAL